MFVIARYGAKPEADPLNGIRNGAAQMHPPPFSGASGRQTSGETMQLKLYMTAPMTEALGPFKRFTIWVQGCGRRCKGCISPDAQPMDGGYPADTHALAAEILASSDIEGITISGGEPFLQQDALCELIDLIRAKRDLGVIVYTGMLYEEVAASPLARRCDLIIDGPYIEELNDDRSLRGSSNQRVISVTGRYRPFVEQAYGQPGRKVEFFPTDTGIRMVGVPNKDLLKLL